MPAYTYEAITESGATEHGVVEADSERAAKTQVLSPVPGRTPPRMSISSDGMPVEIGLGR